MEAREDDQLTTRANTSDWIDLLSDLQEYHYDWLTGPNPGYGFAGGTCPPSTLTDEDHIEAIRDFLAEIDPETGYLSDD